MGGNNLLANLIGGQSQQAPAGIQNQTNQSQWWGGQQSSQQPTSGYGTFTQAPQQPAAAATTTVQPAQAAQQTQATQQSQQDIAKERQREALQGQMNMRQQELIALQGQLANLSPGSYQYSAKQSMINNTATQLRQLQLQLAQLG